MPYRLHPSGYCSFFERSTSANLQAGLVCKFCGWVAGHSANCEYELMGCNSLNGSGSRNSLFNATSVLWAKEPEKSFITFTLPSRNNGVYQKDIHCPYTGDLVVARAFSKVLEAYALRVKRHGKKTWSYKSLSYVWVAEAQKERQEKWGGVADIHYHLVVNEPFKDYSRGYKDGKFWRYPFVSEKHRLTLEWLQNLWCLHLGTYANNCVHVDPLPDGVDSIPAYMSKYLGKGSQRKIWSRRFGASRDLTVYRPIDLEVYPTANLIRTVEKRIDEKFTHVSHYFGSRSVLELYGHLMKDASRFGPSVGRAKDFTPEKIEARKGAKINRIAKEWEQVLDDSLTESVLSAYNTPTPSAQVTQRLKEFIRQGALKGLS